MGSLLATLTNLRYVKAVEDYARVAGRLNLLRSGAVPTTGAVVARGAAHANQTRSLPSDDASDPDRDPAPLAHDTPVSAAIAALGRGTQTMIEAEQALSAPLGRIPFPRFPALRVWDLDLGLPHAHNHPPNLIPPSPVPIPLPSMGPILPIPILSGASSVLINGRPAARCGDLGLGIFCGGFFPLYEIFLGSANTWIEGARAGRVLVDITLHCIFSAPRPSDPPLGPMVGLTLPPASPNVMIGGVPMPSLFSLAISQSLRAVFKLGGRIARQATAKAYVNKLLKKGSLKIDPSGAPASWSGDVVADLEKVATTRTGRETLKRIERSGRSASVTHYDGWTPTKAGPVWDPHNAWAMPVDEAGAAMDLSTAIRSGGSDAIVAHNPAHWANHVSGGVGTPPPGTSSDSVLLHELNHAANSAEGVDRQAGSTTVDDWDERWDNFEEYDAIAKDNGYRLEVGLPRQRDYGVPLP